MKNGIWKGIREESGMCKGKREGAQRETEDERREGRGLMERRRLEEQEGQIYVSL